MDASGAKEELTVMSVSTAPDCACIDWFMRIGVASEYPVTNFLIMAGIAALINLCMWWFMRDNVVGWSHFKWSVIVSVCVLVIWSASLLGYLPGHFGFFR